MNLGEPSTSWAPVWNGIVLPNFEPYGALVEDEVTPARGRGPDWTKKTILGQLENTPTGKDVIWETVLALFRLRSLEDEEMKGKLWQQLVSAWMHRHVEVCKRHKIQPLVVISDFAKYLVSDKGIPAEMVPSFREEVEKLKVGPPGPPRPSARRKRVKVVEEDVEMGEGDKDVPKTVTFIPDQKGKQKEMFSFTPASTSAKRDLPVSPNQPVIPSKRFRTTRSTQDVPAIVPKTPDFSDMSVCEDTVVTMEFLPEAEGMICTHCSKTGNNDCKPIWRYWSKRQGAPLWCSKCMGQAKGCSFKDYKWNVMAWPTVTKTLAGDNRRQENLAKRKKKAEETGGLAPAVTRAQSEGSSIGDQTFIAESGSGYSLSTTNLHVAPGLLLRGRYEMIFLEDIQSLSEILERRDRSAIGIEAKLIEIRAVVERERHLVDILDQLVTTRSEILVDLIQRMNIEYGALTGRRTKR